MSEDQEEASFASEGAEAVPAESVLPAAEINELYIAVYINYEAKETTNNTKRTLFLN
ncbi:hypothetical protein ACFSC5_09465 [Oceanobacillus bengalensis]|uniref:hypothetical protein n=1 Tax=Oceanobacillus bengalensis TaxID=1435466 RepID=UPI001FEC4DE5|nr:hypothetical protein [Oceanobacillus bengalensis]